MQHNPNPNNKSSSTENVRNGEVSVFEPRLQNPTNQSDSQRPNVASLSKWKPLSTAIPLVLLPLMILMRFVPDLVPNGPSAIWMASAFGPLLISLLIMLWWLSISRARWFERLIGTIGLIGILMLEQAICHPSMQGTLLVVMTIPMAIAGFALGLILMRNSLSLDRTRVALGLALAAALVSALLRTDGVWGNFAFSLAPRWKPTAEDLALKDIRQAEKMSTKIDVDTATLLTALKSPDWPTLRGPDSASRQTGTQFSDNWKETPPTEIWRSRVGPAWSSFAVAANRLFTQEQRGENEAVTCYNANNGEPIWSFKTPSRFFEPLGGLGPRATPTLADGSIYALGAEGTLVRLNALDGKLIWKADLKQASERDLPPMWGFSSSPCVENDTVIVHAGGKGDKGVIAFHIHDGSIAWSAPAGEMSYSSVQKITLLNQPLLCLLSNLGVHLWDLDGNVVLNYDFPHLGYRALQAQVIDGNKLLIPAGMGTGTQLVEFSLETTSDSSSSNTPTEPKATTTPKLSVKELWTSKEMKPDYNDLLIHKGHIYGFDNAIFACIGLDDGKRRWKGGRYEKGQAFLLADSDLILVVSEPGDLVLLRATPEKHEEIAKIPALKDKTWNHPVVIGDRLFLRNAEEAVCYKLPTPSLN
jgi:outer membrane protein assembly factor BamB